MDRAVAQSSTAAARDDERTVDPAEALNGQRDRPVRLGRDGEVGGQPTRLLLAAGGGYLRGEGGRMVRIPRDDEDGGTLGREPARARRCDPGRSGDQAHAIGEPAGGRHVLDANRRGTRRTTIRPPR